MRLNKKTENSRIIYEIIDSSENSRIVFVLKEIGKICNQVRILH